MTQNRRIVLNIVATYGRSLYALVCGLFTARWVLMTLGEVDYGLIGVVGGLVGFMSFFNGLMASSVSRFYAFAVGQAQVSSDKETALDDCRRWFNAAVAIHTVVPIVSLLIGYPIGELIVRNYLTIPPDRLEACVWVFRITCLTCLVSMTAVPYHAMYTAKQEIAELTIYGFATTTLNVVFLWYMVTHQANWFVRYVGWTAFLSVVPSLIITSRAFVKYRECRFMPRYFFDWGRAKEMMRYAGCRFLSSVAMMSAFQGMTILVNRMLGPAQNAAMAVGNNVNGHALSLMGALRTAMTPAITNATGAGNVKRVELLACRTSVYASFAVAVFAIPLCLEMETVLKLWLKNPPEQAGILATLLLIASFIDQLTIGQCLSVLALKSIGKFQVFESMAFFLPLPVAWIVIKFGCGLEGVGLGFIALYALDSVVKLWFAKKQCGLSYLSWCKDVFVPVFSLVVPTSIVGFVLIQFFQPSFFRLIGLTCVIGGMFIVLLWNVALRQNERQIVKDWVWKQLGR